MKEQLRAAIAGMEAVWAVDAAIHIAHVEPAIHVLPDANVWPRLHQPRKGAMLVLTQVLSMKTSRDASIRA